MKLKKILASILCVAMVLSTVGFNVFAEDPTETVVDSTYVAQVGDEKFESVLSAITYALENKAPELKLLADSREVMTSDYDFIIDADLTITADAPVTAAFYNDGTKRDFAVGANGDYTLTIGENVTFDLEDRVIWLGYFDENCTVVVDGTLTCANLWVGTKTVVNSTGKLISDTHEFVMRKDANLVVNGGTVEASYFQLYTGHIEATNGAKIISHGPVNVNGAHNYSGEGDFSISLDNSTFESDGAFNIVAAESWTDGVEITLVNGSSINTDAAFGTTGEVNVSVDATSSVTDVNGTAVAPLVEVTTYEELVAALAEDKANVVMMNDITGTATKGGYNKAGVVIQPGDVLDGNGYKLEIWGADSTWDCAVAITGGTVKNLTVAKAFRGIFMPGANGDVVIDNCKFDNVCYTFNSDAGSKEYGVTIKNTVLNGWTSFSDVHKFVTFENCTFGKGTGDYQYEFCRPYNETTFTGCEFNEGFDFDASAIGDNTLAFNECKYDGEELSTGAGVEMFYKGGNIKIDGEDLNLVANPVAKIGLATFAKLEDAFAAAKDGDVITLINDVTLDEVITIQESIVIDGAGYTISQADECVNEYALLYFDGADVLDITVKNVTFEGVKGGAAVRTLGANMTIDNCVFQNCEHTQVQGLVRLTQGSATITKSKFLNNTCSMVVSFNYDTAGLEGDTFIVDDCEFENNTANSTAVVYYVKGEGCEIKNTEFVGNTVNCNSNGATIYLGFQENCSVIGCLFENNAVKDASTSTRVAGGIFFGYEAEIANNVFKNNSAENANGKDGIGQSVCTSTYYECEINLSENYFDGQAPVEGKDYYIQHKTGEGEFVLNNYYESYTTDSEGNIVLDGRVDVNDVVATNGENYYYSLQDAIDVANAGDVIVISGDVSETVTVNAPAATYSMRSSASGITIDLNNFTLTGNITVNSGATATIKNGTIINDDSSVSAVQTFGTTTLENVDVTSARHAVRVEGGVTTINGGSYKVGTPGMTTHAVNVSDGGKVVINDGVFEGPAGVADSDSGAAVNVQANSTVEIYGGKFSGGKNNTLSATETLVVYGGMFDQDVTAYIAETSEAIDRGAYEYPYGVAPKAAGKINVALKATDNKNVYNIVITSADEYDINEFVSAELTFKNESTTVGDSVMDYKINGYADNKTFAQEAKDAVGLKDNEEQYIISLNDGAKRLSSTDAKDGDGIIIGQVEFFGQGDIKFSVTKGEVDTTWQNTNLGRYYTTEVVAPATEATLGIENASINSNVPEVHRDVAVNVAFNHNIDTNDYWKGYQIEVTLKNSAMGKEYKKTLEIKDIKSGACVFEDVPVGYITVTLKAPGFRTYTYNTTLEETKDNGVLVLNFWNDVKKGNDEAIEKGKDKMAHNFLVGDIVMDMKVDKYDLAAVTSYYGTYGIDKAEAEKYIKYDLNRDGDIDIRDVQYVLHTMGN